jgi:hypothetical protein
VLSVGASAEAWEESAVGTGPVRQSPFTHVFDAVVVGSGYAAYGAVLSLQRRGRSVLLIGPRGDLVWESGRAFCPDGGTCEDAEWKALVDAVGRRGGVVGEWLDGALTEVVATDRLMASGASVLYYARPVAAERVADALTSVIVATKLGLRRVAGRQWIDATETGELLRLIEPALPQRLPKATSAYLMLQHPNWSRVSAEVQLRPTAWSSERVLRLEVSHSDLAWREQVLVGLEELASALGEDCGKVSMSHFSIEPISQYDAGVPMQSPAANMASAAPGFTRAAVLTLADRFMLGVRAAADLEHRPVAEAAPDLPSRPIPRVEPVYALEADVCVVGLGTGGVIAALASAITEARVACVEPLTFAGGIGTGGGIHGYWLGVGGGLQREVDRRTRHLMKRFHGGPLGDGPFNPWAKMIALGQMLRERAVDLHFDALLFDVEKTADRVTAAIVTTPRGVLRIEAEAFVDGTGDGDLCAMAGAPFTHGRDYDGLPHAYTQSSGRLRQLHGRPRMAVVNFDAGFCDATDPEDLTRARLEGVRQYLLESYDNLSRPTYIAPALGIRQGRQVTTEYVLSLDDQISGRQFEDHIGYTAAHCDNHSTDYEFESDEAVFWLWANRQYFARVACGLNYRMLVPRQLSNVWIASRCLGVSQDAHYATRMQRDVQRVGEAAGFAAAEAVRLGQSSLQLPYAELRKWLDQTGALTKHPRGTDISFGSYDFDGAPVKPDALEGPAARLYAAQALAALDRGEPGEAMWWLYRHEAPVRDEVMLRLASHDGRKPMVTWLAATVVAMWKNPAAERRLIESIESCEYGFGEGYEGTRPAALWPVEDQTPLQWHKVVPNWLCAVALLRRCGTQASLGALQRLVDRPIHAVNTLTTVAVTLQGFVERGAIASAGARDQVIEILEQMLSIRLLGELEYAARGVGRYSESAVQGHADPLDGAAALPYPLREQVRNAYQDNTWQLHLAIARARVALGLPVHDAANEYYNDERAFVRRAFNAIPSGPAIVDPRRDVARISRATSRSRRTTSDERASSYGAPERPSLR